MLNIMPVYAVLDVVIHICKYIVNTLCIYCMTFCKYCIWVTSPGWDTKCDMDFGCDIDPVSMSHPQSVKKSQVILIQH